MKKKCEFCGKKKSIEELGTVSCKKCEHEYPSFFSTGWFFLSLAFSILIYLYFYISDAMSFFVGLFVGVVVGLLLNKGSKDKQNRY